MKLVNKTILDVCCGGKMFWFDKTNLDTLFVDNRQEDIILCDGRTYAISPDKIADFRNLPFDDESFRLVVFDPPHLFRVGKKSWLAQKYGRLTDTWRDDLSKGFAECFRVLKRDGVLIFKWNEEQIKLSEILNLTDQKPLFGNQRAKTHWLVFYKRLS